jgi:hypothetical protein
MSHLRTRLGSQRRRTSEVVLRKHRLRYGKRKIRKLRVRYEQFQLLRSGTWLRGVQLDEERMRPQRWADLRPRERILDLVLEILRHSRHTAKMILGSFCRDGRHRCRIQAGIPGRLGKCTYSCNVFSYVLRYNLSPENHLPSFKNHVIEDRVRVIDEKPGSICRGSRETAVGELPISFTEVESALVAA